MPDGEVTNNINFDLPPGLIVVEDFITESEEQRLIDLNEWDNENVLVNSVLKHRQVKHFGYEFQYDTNNVDVNQPLVNAPIPSECDFLWSKTIDSSSQHFGRPDQLTVNKYEPGQGKF